ncbi:MAG: TRAP transporter small permease [Deltaproteobacteria bacterium]|nr:TRAP transporter small permease [Deltaproteobacteria bacterium]
MSKLIKAIIRVISYVNVGFILLLTAVTLVDVIARYLFNTSFLDAMTVSSYLLAMINSLALPGITLKGGHVQVELLFDRLPPGLRRFFAAGNNLLAGALFLCMSWYAFGKAAESWHRGFFQGWMQLPEYPAKFVFAFGCLMTALTFLLLFLQGLVGKEERMAE